MFLPAAAGLGSDESDTFAARGPNSLDENDLASAAAAMDNGVTSASPQLTVTMPFASAVYTSAGVHVTYTMQLRDESHDILWQTPRRYSAYRHLHNTVGKTVVDGKASFPSMLFTARGNRSKKEIELRRVKLEAYMSALLAALRTPVSKRDGGGISLQRLARVLKFLEYPYTDFLSGGLQLRVGGEGGLSSSSSVGSHDSDRISALDVDQQRITALPPPSVVTTRWKPPPALPGPRLGLNMPYVSLTLDIEGHWDVIIRADRNSRKGFLRHRYDEAIAMCASIAKDEYILSAAEAQDFVLRFRKEHPLTIYLSYEKTLEVNTPTSSSRIDRSSGPGASPDSSASNSEVDNDDEEFVGSPHVHHHRDPVGVVQPAETVRQLFPAAASGPGDDLAKQRHGSHFALSDRRKVGRVINGRDYVLLVKGPRVNGCKCTRDTFCSTTGGDVYTTDSGFAIIVCPPADPKPGD